MKTLDDYKKEGWKVSKASITHFEETRDENNKKITVIHYDNGETQVYQGWKINCKCVTSSHVPYEATTGNRANCGRGNNPTLIIDEDIF